METTRKLYTRVPEKIGSPYGRKEISGCGLTGIININGKPLSGEIVRCSIACQHERGNGLGGGFAAYGIYPKYKDYYALHIMYDNEGAKKSTEDYLDYHLNVENGEEIPHRKNQNIADPPILWRYFVKMRTDRGNTDIAEDDVIVNTVMHVNGDIPGAYVFSSGKNMGVFKGVGYPEEIADFFMVESYEGYIWTAHNRFPTNTPGWWGGAHPFTLLDWSIVHNGEISSYGINKRYLEMYGYKLTLLTDTEVVAYLLDLFIRKQGLRPEIACMILAAPFWKRIDILSEREKRLITALRMVYGSGLLNGPFAFIFAYSRGLIGMNDRIKLRPLVAAVKGEMAYMASEESAIMEICPEPERIWAPRAGDPVIVNLNNGVNP
ncbi:MAG: glutamine amidotransferase family protein [Nitrospirota bacterium]